MSRNAPRSQRSAESRRGSDLVREKGAAAEEAGLGQPPAAAAEDGGALQRLRGLVG